MDREESIAKNSCYHYINTQYEGKLGKGLTPQEGKEEGEGMAGG